MIKPQRPAGQRRLRCAGWAAGVIAAASALSACGGSSAPAASGHSPSPQASVTTAATATGSGSGVDRTSAAATLADWLHQLVVADYSAACQDMATGTGSSASPKPTPFSSPQACLGSGTVVELKSLHGNFVVDGLTASSAIAVDPPKAAAASVTINGTSVKVSGTNLTALMVAHSTGVKPGQLSISFALSNLGGSWYVTDLNLDL